MQRNWLFTRQGTWFVSVGLVAILVAAPLIIFRDVWFLTSGAWPRLWVYDDVLIYVSALVATVFCAVNFSVVRSGLPKFVTAVLAISFASYTVQSLAPIHGHSLLIAISIGRIIGLGTLLLLARRYVADLKAGKAAR